MNPPARLNIDAWMLVLSDKEQLEVDSRAIESTPTRVPFTIRQILAFWSHNRRDISGLPLVRYIHDEFKPVGSMGHFVFSCPERTRSKQYS